MQNLPIETLAGKFGTKVFTGVGPHTVSTRAIIIRVADTEIAAATIGGESAIMTDYRPDGTKYYQGEMVTFKDKVTSITLTNATDSITVINED